MLRLLLFAAISPLCAAHVLHKIHTWPINSVKSTQSSAVVDRVVFNISPTVIPADLSWINVTVSVENPLAGDGVAAYAPADVNVTETYPVEWFAIQNANYLKTGNATLQFQMINVRTNYTFVFMRNVNNNPTEVARSGPVSFANFDEPRAIRVIQTSDPTTLRIMWSSAISTAHPFVQYSVEEEWSELKESGNLAEVAALTDTYNKSNLCGAPATTIGYFNVGIINYADITGLVPGKAYQYIVGDDLGVSAPRVVKVPPVAASSVFTSSSSSAASSAPSFVPTKLIMFGDMGQKIVGTADSTHPFPPAPNTTRQIAALIDSRDVDVIHHIGDISYAMGAEIIWDLFFGMLDAYHVADRVPYQVDLGNHEADWPVDGIYYQGADSGGECGVPALRLFRNPQPSLNEPWYTVTSGSVRIIHLATEWNFTTGSPQWIWLKNVLDNEVDYTVTPWVIVGFHRPMYADCNGYTIPWGCQIVAALLQQHVEPLFYDPVTNQSRVDVVVMGHFHDYQRFCAVRNNTCVTRSQPMQAERVQAETSESGASGVFSSSSSSSSLTSSSLTAPVPVVYQHPEAPVFLLVGTAGAPISCCRFNTTPAIIDYEPSEANGLGNWYGFGHVDVMNTTHLHWTFRAADDGSVQDDVWIVKEVR